MEADRRVLAGGAAALLIAALLGFEAIGANAATIDEPYHLGFGGRILETGTVIRDRYFHDGLMPWSALPAALAGIGAEGPRDLLQLSVARAVTLLTLLGLAATLGLAAAWRTGKPWAGVVGASLVLASPNLLAHGTLATTDAPEALFCLLAAVGALGVAGSEDRRWVALLGAGLLGAWVTKHSGLLVGALLLGVLALRARAAWKRWLPAFAAAWLGLFLLPPSASVGTLGGLTDEANVVVANWFEPRTPLPEPALAALPVPLPRAQALGLRLLAAHELHGQPGFLRGAHHTHGRPDYFAWLLLLKTPLAAQIALLAALGLALRSRREEDWFLLLPAVAFVAYASLASSLHMGFRHLLPVVPLVQLWATVRLVDGVPRTRAAAAAAAVLGLFAALETSTARPHYLGFYGLAWGGGDAAWESVDDANLDWGQEDDLLRAWIAQAGEPVAVRPKQAVTGLVAISANDRNRPGDGVAWVEDGELVARVGVTWFVFRVGG